MNRIMPLVCAIAALIGVMPVARAGVDECGDVFIAADADCEIVPPGADCQSQCTPISFETACAAELYSNCAGGCSAESEINCSDPCQIDCSAECMVDPGSFACGSYCESACASDCTAICSDSECGASCRSTCAGECSASCDVIAPSVSCDAKCEASCSGRCTAEANAECQIDCQSDGYLDCQTDVEGGCTADCAATEGALFCDGQYIDVGGSLDACVDAIETLLDIEVMGSADVDCDDNGCAAMAEAGGGCSVTDEGTTAFLLALLIVSMIIIRRRSSDSRKSWRPLLAVAIIGLLGAGCSGSVEAEIVTVAGPGGDATLTVVNQSSFVFDEMYVAEVDDSVWGPNLLGFEGLFPGEELIVADIRCDFYDVLVVDEIGAECELDGIDLCFSDTVWEITDRTLSSCPVFRARMEQ